MNRVKHFISAGVAVISLVGAAHAQEAAEGATAASGQDAASAGDTGEIVVTATRRAEKLRDIPASIAAFGGEKLQSSGVFDVTQLDRVAAGVQVATAYGGYQRVTVRGIGSNQVMPGGNPSVAVHRDGVYLQANSDFGLGFFDVERIEVLRGPQGTLYGRNATGGAVNVITGSPTDTFQAGGNITFGNYSLVETEGFASGPIAGDELTGRIAFKTRKDDGFVKNVRNGEAYNGSDFAGVRAKLRYQSTSDFLLELGADFNRDNAVALPYFTRARTNVPLPSETAGFALPSPPNVDLNYDNNKRAEIWGTSARMEIGLGSVELRSLTGYRQYTLDTRLDTDGQPLDLSNSRTQEKLKQFSQELTLSSVGNGDFKWVAGLFYFHLDNEGYRTLAFPQRGTAQINNIPSLKTDAYAVFGEASYKVMPDLTLTVGGRFSYEKKSILQTQSFAGAALVEDLSDSWKDFSPKASLIYEINPEVNAYATVSRGFKGGAYNGYALQGRAVEPERVTNYEFGLKNRFFGGRLTANLSAFYMDYTNLQVSIYQTNPLTGASTAALANAATARIKGVEFDFDATPSEFFGIYGNASYLDAKFKSWPNAIDPARGGATFDVSGNQLPYAPKFSFNLGTTFTLPVGNWGSATLLTEYSYRSRTYFSAFEDNFLSQAAYGLLNMRLSFTDDDKKWQFAVWGKNITNKLAINEALENYSAISGQRSTLFPIAPRTYGVTVGYKF
ncbi:iron complex outermembrane recepter protein [Sphingobium sp. AP50]|uniref:TonB-dependent receptor n=1 Tax=Sphingobium sp. AP50 TaxID=1884369 RepID=UPI0008B0DF83|nr:TonB-dependent receptor [Sphingobium sp. AP50]SEJ66194.1 iron complex outermembrane recepter protein [Sphingobium sp. AP50]